MARENRQRASRLLDPWKEFYRKSQIQYCGKRFETRSYGLCHWSRVVFLWKNGREFYKLTRNMKVWVEKGDNDVYRREYFRGRLVRRYAGPQNCFVEFCEFLWEHGNYPTKKRFSQVAQALRLNRKATDKYTNFYQQCFCPKSR